MTQRWRTCQVAPSAVAPRRPCRVSRPASAEAGVPQSRRRRRCAPGPSRWSGADGGRVGRAERGRGHDPGVGCLDRQPSGGAQPGCGGLGPVHRREDPFARRLPRDGEGFCSRQGIRIAAVADGHGLDPRIRNGQQADESREFGLRVRCGRGQVAELDQFGGTDQGVSGTFCSARTLMTGRRCFPGAFSSGRTRRAADGAGPVPGRDRGGLVRKEHAVLDVVAAGDGPEGGRQSRRPRGARAGVRRACPACRSGRAARPGRAVCTCGARRASSIRIPSCPRSPVVSPSNLAACGSPCPADPDVTLCRRR